MVIRKDANGLCKQTKLLGFIRIAEAFMALEMQITKLMLQRIMKEDPSSPHLQHCHIGIRNLERKKAASVPLILLRLS